MEVEQVRSTTTHSRVIAWVVVFPVLYPEGALYQVYSNL
jgi:hypothetical protein